MFSVITYNFLLDTAAFFLAFFFSDKFSCLVLFKVLYSISLSRLLVYATRLTVWAIGAPFARHLAATWSFLLVGWPSSCLSGVRRSIPLDLFPGYNFAWCNPAEFHCFGLTRPEFYHMQPWGMLWILSFVHHIDMRIGNYLMEPVFTTVCFFSCILLLQVWSAEAELHCW